MSELKLTIPNQDIYEVAKRNFPIVVVRALRKAAQQTKTAASREVREVYDLKKAEVDPALRLRVDDSRFTAYIKATGRRFTLARFSAKETSRGLRVRIKRKSIKYIRSGFIGTAPGGNDLVFRRTGDPKRVPSKGRYAGRIIARGQHKGRQLTREPLQVLRTISVARMFGSRAVRGAVKGFFESKFSEVIRHELKFFLFKRAA